MIARLVRMGMLLYAAVAAATAEETFQLYETPSPGIEDRTYEVGEKECFSPIFNTEVVTNVSQPILTAYLPDADTANGTAAIVIPNAVTASACTNMSCRRTRGLNGSAVGCRRTS